LKDEITCENVISRLKFLSEADFNFEPELKFASSHFWELLKDETYSELKSLNGQVLCGLISNESLKLENEESLWKFICSSELIQEFPSLLDHIKYEYLSIESMIEFVEMIDSTFDFLTPNVFAALRARLILYVRPFPTTRSLLSSHPFLPELPPFAGIICYLTQKYGGNILDRGIIVITASSQNHQREANPLRNLVDLNMSSCSWTANQQDS
jgi:hypothetical protein